MTTPQNIRFFHQSEGRGTDSQFLLWPCCYGSVHVCTADACNVLSSQALPNSGAGNLYRMLTSQCRIPRTRRPGYPLCLWLPSPSLGHVQRPSAPPLPIQAAPRWPQSAAAPPRTPLSAAGAATCMSHINRLYIGQHDISSADSPVVHHDRCASSSV